MKSRKQEVFQKLPLNWKMRRSWANRGEGEKVSRQEKSARCLDLS